MHVTRTHGNFLLPAAFGRIFEGFSNDRNLPHVGEQSRPEGL